MSRETLYVGVAKFSGIDGAERAFVDAHDRDPAGFLLGPSAFAVGLVGGATVGGVIEASHLPQLEGPAFDAIRERVPKGSSAVVVISTAERVHAMSEALAGVEDEIRVLA